MTKKIFFWPLLIVLMNLQSANAQNDNLFRSIKIEHWDSKKGMPTDLVLNVYQTKDGFIWMTGYSGLTRFDGVSFTTFNTRTLPLMKSDNVESLLCETNDSTLWIPTNNSGLLACKNGSFTTYLTDVQSLQYRGISQNEELLFSTINRLRFILFDTRTKTYKSINNAQRIELIKAGKIKFLHDADQSGSTWRILNNQLFRINNGKLNEITPAQGLPANALYRNVFTDSRNRVWIASTTGIHIWDGHSFKLFPGMENVSFKFGNPSTGLLQEDNKGGIWAAAESFIAYLAPTSDRFVFNGKTDQQLFQNFNNIIEDKEGNIWISSETGLIKLSQSKFINYSNRDGLISNRISAVCALDNQHFIISTRGVLYMIENGTLKPFVYQHKEMDKYNDEVMHLKNDSKGNIWVCYSSGKILRISKTSEKLFLPNDKYQARYTYEDSDHQMWFGFSNGGIGFLNKRDEIEFLKLQGIDLNTLFISSIRKLLNGSWLITTYSKGVLLIDSKGKGTFLNDKTGLNTINVFHSVEEPDGTVWLATGAGITRIKNGVISNIDFKSGLLENSLFEFLEDQKGYVWLPSNRGVIRVLKQELNDYIDKKITKINWQVFDDGDGMLNRQCVGARHSTITPDGRLLIVTFGGLVEIDPNKLTKNTKPPSVVIHRIMRDGEMYNVTQKNVFKPGNARYIFEYSGLSLVAPLKVQFKFKLIGYDKDWISSIGDRKAFYTNIPSGTYTFQVIASNNDGVWNNVGASYTFTIAPFFYETVWFRILMVVFVILLIWLIIRWRTDASRKRNEILEAEVSSRTSDLNKANSELNQSLNNLKSTQSQLIQSEKMASLGELTAGIAHEIQNPLNFVNNFSEVSREMIEELKPFDKLRVTTEQEELLNDIDANLEKINHHGKRAGDIVKGMLQHSRSSSGTKELTDINALCDEYLRLSYHGLRAKDKKFNARLKTDFDAALEKINIIPQDIGRVVLNLLNNAFYAVNEKTQQNIEGYEPTVSITTKKSGDKVEIKVSDNGNGIPQKVLDKIFQPFFTTKPTGQGTGLGLSLSYDIVKAHGGEIQVKTLNGEGTNFTILIPLNQ